ncbi:flagellar basal body-associated protein FliL [Porphyrobacter algicida]|uniref:Flagellar protein FliL n=1 Tax=Qipengyuania algicida TaxID=1836209 RepID=A0A845ADT4_9SPHN|nr:flagellar basal body-associated FliL family protein [Qipengyuania algicida]MXP27647.1 flagellar basal body-associated protein FliL [Qipengyuania algicida]
MSKDKDKEDTGKKKKGGLMKILLLLVLVLAGAGGGAFALVTFGLVGGHAEAHDNTPKLILKGEEDPYAPVSKGKEEGGAETVYGEGGDEYRVAYFSFGDDFTSNLKNSSALVQTTLAASTRRDGRVLMWMKQHELALRSAILVDLSDTPEEEFMSPEGKDRIQKRLTASINRILKQNEGFGGVDKVYFRSLIIQ